MKCIAFRIGVMISGLDYRRIKSLVKTIFTGIPVMGTTATANNRVVKDLEEQLGTGFFYDERKTSCQV